MGKAPLANSPKVIAAKLVIGISIGFVLLLAVFIISGMLWLVFKLPGFWPWVLIGVVVCFVTLTLVPWAEQVLDGRK